MFDKRVSKENPKPRYARAIMTPGYPLDFSDLQATDYQGNKDLWRED